MPSAKDRVIVLLSGGLDSTTALAWSIDQGFEPYCLSFSYGQQHYAELIAAEAVVHHYGVRHKILSLPNWGGSALNDEAIDVPHSRSVADMSSDIPPTYVPARNTILLSYALALAEIKSASGIVIGVNALDYSGYPDCRHEFIRAYEDMANLATKRAIEGHRIAIWTPLIHLTKAQIIFMAQALKAPLRLTHSCYDPVHVAPEFTAEDHLRGTVSLDAMRHAWLACGTCDSCLLRKKGFAEAGVPDPTRYAEAVA